MVPTPVVLGLTLCDYVIFEQRTKKATLVGTFTKMSVQEFPTIALPFSVYAVMTEGRGDGIVELSVIRLDTDEEIYSHRAMLHFPQTLTEVSYHLRLGACKFPVPGLYQFTLLVDGEWVSQKRLRVYQREGES